MLLQLGLILAFLALGELVIFLTGIPVPSSIIGMLLLTLALKVKIIKPRHVDKIADFLVHNLGFFFVPAGVGLMNCLGIIADQWLPIIGASVGSTVVIILVTGWVHRSTRRFIAHRNIARLQKLRQI